MLTFLMGSIRREIQQRLVFRWAVIIDILATATMLGVFFIVDRFQVSLFGDKLQTVFEHLNTSYFGYVSISLAVAALANTGLSSLLDGLHEEKGSHTLEVIMSSPVSIELWAVATGLTNFIRALIRFALIVALSSVAMNFNVSSLDWPVAVLILATAMIPLWCLAMLSLCAAMVFRRGHPVSFLISLAFEVLGGVYAPLSVLPRPLQMAAEFLPITPAIRAMQTVVYSNGTLTTIAPDLVQLAVLSAIYVPAALLAIRASDRVCRQKGYYCLS